MECVFIWTYLFAPLKKIDCFLSFLKCWKKIYGNVYCHFHKISLTGWYYLITSWAKCQETVIYIVIYSLYMSQNDADVVNIKRFSCRTDTNVAVEQQLRCTLRIYGPWGQFSSSASSILSSVPLDDLFNPQLLVSRFDDQDMTGHFSAYSHLCAPRRVLSIENSWGNYPTCPVPPQSALKKHTLSSVYIASGEARRYSIS